MNGKPTVLPSDPPYLTSDELAERYQVPVQTVRYWRHMGTGPKAVKIGRFVRYRMDAVLMWEKELEAAAR